MRRENEHRRDALIEAVARYLPKDAKVGGSAAGLHVVLWLAFLRPADELALAEAAGKAGVGIYPVSPLFASRESVTQPRPAGFILGYASPTVEQIRQGLQILGGIVARGLGK